MSYRSAERQQNKQSLMTIPRWLTKGPIRQDQCPETQRFSGSSRSQRNTTQGDSRQNLMDIVPNQGRIITSFYQKIWDGGLECQYEKWGRNIGLKDFHTVQFQISQQPHSKSSKHPSECPSLMWKTYRVRIARGHLGEKSLITNSQRESSRARNPARRL